MSRINFFHIALVLIVGLSLSSCKKYFGDVNVDPDNPSAVTPDVLLPQTQVRLAYTHGGDASRYLSIYTQHIDGVSRQFAVIQDYGIQSSDVDAMWANYWMVMQDLRKLRETADANGYNVYSGLERTLTAYTLMEMTDIFGDMPYSEALQGDANFQPTFDTQQGIYNSVFNLLDSAEAFLTMTETGGVVPGADDIIYNGDASMWVKFVYALRARAYLHLGKDDPANYTNAWNQLANAFTSSADDARLAFGGTSTSAAPWYQYNEQRNDISPGANLQALMVGLNDTMRWGVWGANMTDYASHPYFTSNQAVPLLTYMEQKFIEAECLLQTGGADTSVMNAYMTGIAESFNELGLSSEFGSYTSQTSVNPGLGSVTLNEVITQKHIAMFTDPEVFNDWRRTGIPDLNANPNSGTEVPRRLPYPETEIQYNNNAPKTVTIYDRVWWDQ